MLQFKDTEEGAEALERTARKHMRDYAGERVVCIREARSIAGEGETVLRGRVLSPRGRFLGYL